MSKTRSLFFQLMGSASLFSGKKLTPFLLRFGLRPLAQRFGLHDRVRVRLFMGNILP
jgi:hypothetical protein